MRDPGPSWAEDQTVTRRRGRRQAHRDQLPITDISVTVACSGHPWWAGVVPTFPDRYTHPSMINSKPLHAPAHNPPHHPAHNPRNGHDLGNGCPARFFAHSDPHRTTERETRVPVATRETRQEPSPDQVPRPPPATHNVALSTGSGSGSASVVAALEVSRPRTASPPRRLGSASAGSGCSSGRDGDFDKTEQFVVREAFFTLGLPPHGFGL